ncbi:MAG: fumarylacetoacetate hydrolase family protein [Burkholderiaceae bacterium]
MRLCRFNDKHVGVVIDDHVYDITELLTDIPRPSWPYPPQDWLIASMLTEHARLAATLAELHNAPGSRFPRIKLADLTLQAPVANPGKIIGAPVNYRAHIDEANADEQISYSRAIGTLEDHGLFLKANTALIGPDGEIELPFPDRRTDHEVELGVIIGQPARRVTRDEAMQHVFGYCVALDITVRGKEFPGFRKSPDTFAVIGPWVTTADEIANPNALDLALSVNGEMRQQSNTQHLILNVERLIEYASAMYTLMPGDVIMTGTPAGVGPIEPGDLLEATVDGLGQLVVSVAQSRD